MLQSQATKKTGATGSPAKRSAAHSLQQQQQTTSGIQTGRKQQLIAHSTRPNNAFQFVGNNSHNKQRHTTPTSMDEEVTLGNLLEDVVQNDQPKPSSAAASTLATPPQYITVSLEDLEEAGIDVQNVDKLTEPQIQNLLAISEQNRKRLAERQSTPESTSTAVPTSEMVNSMSVSPQQLNQGQPTDKSVYKPAPSPFRDDLRASTSQQHSGQPSEAESIIEVEKVVEEELGVQETPLNSNGPPRLTREQALPRREAEEETMEEDEEEDLPGPHGADSQITITITDEGHVKLTDASHQTFFFSRDELSHRNIDAANLTDANIQDIIQMALPSLVMGRPSTDEPSPKKRQLRHSQLASELVINNSPHKGSALRQSHPTHHNGVSSSSSSSTIGQAPSFNHSRPTPNISGISVSPSNSTQPPPLYFNRREQMNQSASIMIGGEVEVRRQGNTSRTEMAVVRYFRPGYGYKVQFSDGHFEWITEGNVQDIKEAPATPFCSRTRPQTQIDPIAPTNLIKKADKGATPTTNNHQRHHQQARMVSGSSSMSSSTNHLHKESPVPSQETGNTMEKSSTAANNLPNNFYCSICDQTVNQNELSYIVIRVLACKPCSTSKVLILDEEESREERPINSLPSTSTQTNDCFINNTKEKEPTRAIESKNGNRGRAFSTPKELHIGVQPKTGIAISSVRSNAFEKESTRII